MPITVANFAAEDSPISIKKKMANGNNGNRYTDGLAKSKHQLQ